MPYIGKKPADIIATAVDTTTGTFSGDIDVDGTTNLDVVDIDGAVDFASTTAHAGNATFADNAKAIFGAGSDLQIYHNGSNSYIKDTTTGNLNITGNDIQILNAAADEAMAYFAQDGGVTLYHNGLAKLATTATGIDVTGTVTSTGTSVFASLDISGDIDVDGTTNLDVVDIDGAVNMASTALVTGVLTANGGAVFNEGGADIDFRVESDTSSHALFLNSADLRWGINRTDPQKTLEISSNLEQLRLSTSSEPTNYYTDISSRYDSANPFRMRGYYGGTTVDFIEITAGGGFTSPALKLGEGMSYVSLYTGTTEHVVLQATGLAINESGADADFRVESDVNANAFFLEGSTGKVAMGTATTNAELYLSKTTAGEVVRADNSQSSFSGVMFYSVIFGTGNNNGSTSADKHFAGYAGGAMRYVVCGNGDVKNTNNSYGAYSDLKLKENIVDSGSQWDDIKALRVRKYSMKDEYSDAPTKIGVIAQELEAVGMGGLVTEGADLDVDNNDLGTTTKQVTYSVLYMKAVKALQEAMERIESLEARITALES